MRPQLTEAQRRKLYGRIWPSTNFAMFYVYVLRNKINQELYYGYTADLERRFNEHNKIDNWKLVYYEAYLAEDDARKRERHLKHYGQSRAHLKSRLEKSLQVQN